MIYRVDEGFIVNNFNPFTDMMYDNSWVVFCLTGSEDYQVMSGGIKPVYTIKVSKKHPEWQMSVMDFVEYNEAYNKNMILSISDADFEEAKRQYGLHHYNENCLRDYEPRFLIHSTTREHWENIKNDGCLKSWNMLKQEKPNRERHPIGKELGDSDDYSDFIMFSEGGLFGEIVVLSKQKGSITMDPDMRYQTGARLYFDVEEIVRHGLLIRDGCHLKVKNMLPLSPHLLWVGDWKSVGL